MKFHQCVFYQSCFGSLFLFLMGITDELDSKFNFPLIPTSLSVIIMAILWGLCLPTISFLRSALGKSLIGNLAVYCCC